jgi:zinc D-Ala-D-Ala carboxypeptidase
MQLTNNFTLEELTKSETALRQNIDNTPTDDIVANLRTLAENVLQPVRDHFGKGVKVNSGFRSMAVNAAVGGVQGAKPSDHTRGLAADIEIPGVPNAELAQWIEANLEYTQVILEFYTQGIPDSGWVHVSFDPNSLRKQSLTAVKQDGKTVYLAGLHA